MPSAKQTKGPPKQRQEETLSMISVASPLVRDFQLHLDHSLVYECVERRCLFPDSELLVNRLRFGKQKYPSAWYFEKPAEF
jgi:hypothetical protein